MTSLEFSLWPLSVLCSKEEREERITLSLNKHTHTHTMIYLPCVCMCVCAQALDHACLHLQNSCVCVDGFSTSVFPVERS